MDPNSPNVPYQKAIDYVRHECGHMVSGVVLGFEVGRMELKDDQAGAEIVLDPILSSIEEIRSYVERRIQVLYAGAFAQALQANRVNADFADYFLTTTAGNDFAKIRELAKVLVGIERQEQCQAQELLDAVIGRLRTQTAVLVENHFKDIHDLALWFLNNRRAGSDGPRSFIIDKDRMNASPVLQKLKTERSQG